MELAQAKQQLRALALDKRQELRLDVDFIMKSTSAIGEQLLSVPCVQKVLSAADAEQGEPAPPIFASYAPTKGEANPNGFLDLLEQAGRSRPRLAFPRICGKSKLALHFAVLDDLLPGSFGILEPSADLPLAQLFDIAVILVPGVAFDRRGNRLGYGKGFYDQFLLPLQQTAHTAAQRPILVGISFDETLFDEIPTGDHDIRMDYVATPRQIIVPPA